MKQNKRVTAQELIDQVDLDLQLRSYGINPEELRAKVQRKE